jgi:hypothetical protein
MKLGLWNEQQECFAVVVLSLLPTLSPAARATTARADDQRPATDVLVIDM